MTFYEIREYCLAKRGVTLEFPFDETTPVFKVAGKMFLLADSHDATSMNLKCLPEVVLDRREKYSAVLPAYHMNKSHWITVELDGSIENRELFRWIDDSYSIVEQKLPKSVRNLLAESE